MDENKNLTPDGEEENNIPEETAEEVTEEVIEEAAEENEEEPAAESVIVPEEAEEIITEKKSKGGIIAAIIGLVALIGIVLAFIFTMGSADKNGTVNPGYAAIKGNSVYHISYSDYKLHKTPVEGGEDKVLTEDQAIYIAGYKNDIYYLTYAVAEDNQTSIFQFRKFVDGVNDIVIVEDEMASIQIADGYVYYFKTVPEFYSGYSNRVYRAKLKENSAPEMVCDCLALSFYVEGNDLYYCDVETASLMKVDINETVKHIALNPLPEGGKRASAELLAEEMVKSVVINPTVVRNKLYFIDAQNNYELCVFNLKTKEISGFGNGVFTNNFNIYGEHIYYYNVSDYSFYRMRLDGSDINKISGVNYYGFSAISNDKIMFLEISDEGVPYISLCDLDGNMISEITLTDESVEEYYDDSAVELPEDGEEVLDEVLDEVENTENTELN